MKKQSSYAFSLLSKEDNAQLTTQVEESIAFGFVAPTKRIFTEAELWNIQRQVRARVQRRFL